MKKILLALSIALVLGLSGCPYYEDIDPLLLHTPQALSHNSVQLEWDAPKGYEEEVWGYIIKRYRNGFPAEQITLYETETSYIDEGLEGSSEYAYTITPSLSGPYYTVESNKESVTTLADPLQLLATPTNITATYPEGDTRRIILSWTPSEGADSYEIKTYKGNSYLSTMAVVDTSSAHFNSLMYGNNYSFSIKAINTAASTYSKTSQHISQSLPYLDYASPDNATPLYFNTEEPFYIKMNNTASSIWGSITPSEDSITISVEEYFIGFWVYRKNPNGEIEFLGTNNTDISGSIPTTFSGVAGKTCLIRFFSKNLQSSDYPFNVMINQGE